jgi:hypothetical protein
MDRIGQRLLDERKAALVADPNATDGARDLLSLLVRANTSADLAHRLSDADVLARECLLPAAFHIHLMMCRDSDIPHGWARDDVDAALVGAVGARDSA